MSCPTHTTPQDVNLDCFVKPDELDPFINDENLPDSLRDYAREKKEAMSQRLAGNIQIALDHEANCQKIYETIPENWQW